MKYLIILFALVVVSTGLHQKNKDKINNTVKECLESSGVEKESLARLKDGHTVDDPKVKTFFLCFFQKLKFQNADGTINAERIKQHFPTEVPQEERNAIFNDCLIVKGVDSKDTAYLLYKCIKSKLTGHYSDLLI